MTTRALVSVMVPAYNGERLLADALASVQGQTYQEVEIIVVDDGSTDGTLALAREMASHDRRIQVFTQANGGTQVARNTALHQARGEWIALLDQDDVWLAEKLERQMSLLGERPCPDLLYCNYYYWDGVRDLGRRYANQRKMFEGEVANKLAYSCLFEASSVVVKKQRVEAAGGFDPRLHFAGDWDLWLRLAEQGLCVRGVHEPLMRHRLWEGNESKKIVPMARQTLGVLEKALARPQKPALKRHYECAAALARSNLELACARQYLVAEEEKIPQALWQAWRLYPRRMKWLLRWVCVVWPRLLGGNITSAYAYRKLRGRN